MEWYKIAFFIASAVLVALSYYETRTSCQHGFLNYSSWNKRSAVERASLVLAPILLIIVIVTGFMSRTMFGFGTESSS